MVYYETPTQRLKDPYKDRIEAFLDTMRSNTYGQTSYPCPAFFMEKVAHSLVDNFPSWDAWGEKDKDQGHIRTEDPIFARYFGFYSPNLDPIVTRLEGDNLIHPEIYHRYHTLAETSNYIQKNLYAFVAPEAFDSNPLFIDLKIPHDISMTYDPVTGMVLICDWSVQAESFQEKLIYRYPGAKGLFMDARDNIEEPDRNIMTISNAFAEMSAMFYGINPYGCMLESQPFYWRKDDYNRKKFRFYIDDEWLNY